MRRDVTFKTLNGGLKLAGWLYTPDRSNRPAPAIVLSHGTSVVKEMGLDRIAEIFTDAGFVCLAYDHRNLGSSEGSPRGEINPWLQCQDMRDAITFAGIQPEVDKTRIGIWGTSYSGGHVIMVGAWDRRVKCVVSQVPSVSGLGDMRRMMSGDDLAALRDKLDAERERIMRGEPPTTIAIATSGVGFEWLTRAGEGTPWINQQTLISRDMYMEWDPAACVHRIAPTPFMMIVGNRDTRCPTDTQIEAFMCAGEPKKLVVLDGNHYDPYERLLDQCSNAARDWFALHLMTR